MNRIGETSDVTGHRHEPQGRWLGHAHRPRSSARTTARSARSARIRSVATRRSRRTTAIRPRSPPYKRIQHAARRSRAATPTRSATRLVDRRRAATRTSTSSTITSSSSACRRSTTTATRRRTAPSSARRYEIDAAASSASPPAPRRNYNRTQSRVVHEVRRRQSTRSWSRRTSTSRASTPSSTASRSVARASPPACGFDHNSAIDSAPVAARRAVPVASPRSTASKLLYARRLPQPERVRGVLLRRRQLRAADGPPRRDDPQLRGGAWAKPIAGAVDAPVGLLLGRERHRRAASRTEHDARPLLQFQNVGEIVSRGVEVEASYRNSGGWYALRRRRRTRTSAAPRPAATSSTATCRTRRRRPRPGLVDAASSAASRTCRPS